MLLGDTGCPCGSENIPSSLSVNLENASAVTQAWCSGCPQRPPGTELLGRDTSGPRSGTPGLNGSFRAPAPICPAGASTAKFPAIHKAQLPRPREHRAFSRGQVCYVGKRRSHRCRPVLCSLTKCLLCAHRLGGKHPWSSCPGPHALPTGAPARSQGGALAASTAHRLPPRKEGKGQPS